jgi:trafficking protein particle complex subunit 10
VYKNSVKKQIKDWHALVIQKKHQEWLILLVVRSDTRASSGFFSSAKSNILDKIKADFNADKRDRQASLVVHMHCI